MGLVCLGWSGCILQVLVGAVCDFFGRVGNGRPLNVRCRGLVSSAWVRSRV